MEHDGAPEIRYTLVETTFGDDASLDCECSWPHDPDVNGRRKTRRNLPAMKTYSRSISAR